MPAGKKSKTAAREKAARKVAVGLRARLASKWKRDLKRADLVLAGVHKVLRTARKSPEVSASELDLKMRDVNNLRAKLDELRRVCFIPSGRRREDGEKERG